MLFLLSLNCFYNFFGSGSFFRKPFGRKTFGQKWHACGLYYKCFIIVIYDGNDSCQYYKTRITIVIDDLC